MSFDLYLRGDNLQLTAILDYFDKYPDFQRQKLPDVDLGYALVDQATGVYCYFRVAEHTKEDAQSLCFSLNYNRPTFFALETMPVVDGLCRQFQLEVEDPQEEVVGPASLQSLISSWRIHNERAVKALKAQGVALNYMPERKANEWWAYARVREKIAADLGDSVFVPEVFILKRPAEEPFRMIVWPEGNRQILPPSDVVWIDRSDDDRGLVSGARFFELVVPYTSEYRTETESYRLLDPVWHTEVIALTRTLELMPITTQYEQIGPDGFHDVVLD
jgi:hypothetical protein